MVVEPDFNGEQDPANDEHGNVHREPVECGANEEDDTIVERRGELGERHTVELAILVCVHHLLLLGVQRREEALQKGVHRSHAIGDADVVAEDETAGGGDEVGEEDEDGQLPWVISLLHDDAATTTGYDGRRNENERARKVPCWAERNDDAATLLREIKRGRLEIAATAVWKTGEKNDSAPGSRDRPSWGKHNSWI
jgi:hypothetical protein